MFGSYIRPPYRLLPHTAIVRTLKEYKRPLPIHYLAHILDQEESNIREKLAYLEEKGIVKLEGENVVLMP